MFVDQDVVGMLEGAARQILEAAAHAVELGQIDARYAKGSSTGWTTMPMASATCGCLLDLVHHAPRECEAPLKRDDRTGGGAAHHDVGADAARAALRILQHAVAEPHQGQDQGHRHADQQNAEQAAHGPVLEVFQDEFAGHFWSVPFGGSARAAAVRGRLADHLQRGSFGLLQHEFIVRHALVDIHLHDVDHHARIRPAGG